MWPTSTLLRFPSCAAGRAQTLLDAVDEVGGRFLLTADHGNAEEMYQHNKKTGKPLMDKHGKPAVLTSHTLNPVRDSPPTTCLHTIVLQPGPACPQVLQLLLKVPFHSKDTKSCRLTLGLRSKAESYGQFISSDCISLRAGSGCHRRQRPSRGRQVRGPRARGCRPHQCHRREPCRTSPAPN